MPPLFFICVLEGFQSLVHLKVRLIWSRVRYIGLDFGWLDLGGEGGEGEAKEERAKKKEMRKWRRKGGR